MPHVSRSTSKFILRSTFFNTNLRGTECPRGTRMVVVVAVRARAQWVPSSIAMDPGAASWFCEQQTVQGGASPPATAELQWPLRCNREAACPFEHMEAIPEFLSVCECQQAASVGSTATGRCPTGRRTGALCSCALWASEGRAPPPPSARRSPCQQAIGRSPCSCAAARAPLTPIDSMVHFLSTVLSYYDLVHNIMSAYRMVCILLTIPAWPLSRAPTV